MRLPKIVIDRKFWDRGRGQGKGYLLKGERYCLLGAILLALGLPRVVIGQARFLQFGMLHGQDPAVIDLLFEPKKNDESLRNPQGWVVEIEEVNDDKVLTEDEREKRAKQVLGPVGFEVSFIGCEWGAKSGGWPAVVDVIRVSND